MRLMGPFEIHEPIARGGHAIVHAARWAGAPSDPPSAGLVAKVALGGTELTLHRENATLRSVEHPNVIAPVGFVDDAVQVALVLPRAACSLRAHTGRLGDSGAANVLIAIAGALDALHRVGFVHADITAGNILLLDDGTPVLSDLGSAVPSTSAGTRVDVAALALAVRETLIADRSSLLHDLLVDVERAPCDAPELIARVRALDIDPCPIDVHAGEPVVIEPPTIVVD